MGLSTSKSTTTSNATRNEQTSGTQMPVVPANLQSGLDQLIAQFARFGQADPSSLVAGASPLQQAAWAAAQNLSGWQGQNVAASNMAQGAGQAGPNLAGAPAQVTAQGYQAPSLGAAQGYGAASAGNPAFAGAQGYDPTQAGKVTIDPIERAKAESLLTNLGSYMSPHTNDVVDMTLRGVDDRAGRVQASQAAAAARNKAFGGSRHAITIAQTEADTARERAATEAGLRDRAFNVGAGLSADDANRRQQAGLTNAAAANARALAQAGFDMQGNLFNADAANRAAEFLAGSRNQAGMFDADSANRFALDQAGRTDAASQFGAQANNAFAALQAQLQADASRFGADAKNQAGAFNAAAQNAMAQFDAGQRDNAQARALQAAGLMGNLASDRGAGQRADVAAQGAAGDQQRGVEQQQALAQLAQLQALAQLYGGLPLDALVGRSMEGSSSMTASGKEVTKSKPGLFQALMAMGEKAANAYMAGRG